MSIFDSLIESKIPTTGEIKLVKEDDDGYIEYKLRLDSKNSLGLTKMASQMNFRLETGKILLSRKEAHYVLGIKDDGTLGGLSEDQLDKTFSVFSKVVSATKSTMVHIDKKRFNESYLMYVIVQKIETERITELNIAFVGPTQHGKTTTISHIVYGQHDDGKGYARNLVFKHEHEKRCGVTSCVKKEIIGLRSGKLINYSIGIQTSWENIVEMSDKVVNLIDLPGSDKYIRSTLFGLSAYHIDGIVIVLDTSKITSESIKEYMFYEQYANTMKIPFVTACISNESIDSLYFTTFLNKIEISNLNYLGFDDIIDFFDNIKTIDSTDESEIADCVFFVVEINFIPDVGFTFSGTMRSGILSLKDDVYLTNGTEYYPAKIKSIQRKQIDSQTLFENEGGAIRLEVDNSIASVVTKYMMIVKKKYTTYDSLVFKISDSRQNNLLVNDGQKCILFINNNIVQVVTTNDSDKSLINLKISDNKIILPKIGKYKCFLKTEHTIIIVSIVLF